MIRLQYIDRIGNSEIDFIKQFNVYIDNGRNRYSQK